MADEATKRLIEAGLLPEVMPENFTYRKVREVLKGLEGCDPNELSGAARAAKGLNIRGPLASVIFVKHHLAGGREVEVDRVTESEEGARYAVLVYPEGEVPVSVEFLPAGIQPGHRLRYHPEEARYR